MGVQPAHAAGGPGRRPAPRPTRRRRPRRSRAPSGGATFAERLADHDQRHRQPTPAAVGRRGRGLGRRRRHLAPGRRARRAGPTPGRPGTAGAATIRARAVDDSGNLETPGRSGHRRTSSPGPAPARSGTTRLPAPDGRRHLGGRARRQVPLRSARLHHRGPLLQDSRATPAPTSATSGPRGGPCWPRRPSPARPPPAGSRSTSPPRWRSTPTPPTSPPTTRPTATTPPPTATSFLAGVDSARRCTPCGRRRRAERRLQVRSLGRAVLRRRPRQLRRHQLLGRRRLRQHGRARHDAADDQLAARPAGGAGGVSTSANADARPSASRWTRPRSTATTVELRGPGDALVPATVSYNAAQRRVDARPRSPRCRTRPPTRRRSRAAPAGSPTSPATRSPPTRPGPSRPPHAPPPPPDEGPGGPILVISNSANPFSRYYAEILRAEGLNEFAVTDLSTVNAVDACQLRRRDPRRERPHRRPGEHADQLGPGGRQPDRDAPRHPARRAARPHRRAGGTLANAYLQVDTSTGPGAGIVDQTIQFHGTADRYTPPARRRSPRSTRRHHRDRQPGGDAAERRAERRPGGGVHLRPGPLGRLHAPGQPGLGRGGARRHLRRSAPTTSSSGPSRATPSPTGSTSTRSRSRRPTSSSGCSPT